MDQADTVTQEFLDTQEDASTVSGDSEATERSPLETVPDGELAGDDSAEVRPASTTAEATRSLTYESRQYQLGEESHPGPVNRLHEWSGEVDELPPIVESDDQTDDEEKPVPAPRKSVMIEPKRRSSDTHTRTLSYGRVTGMRRISSMSELLRLKGRLRVPAFLSSKASPASPAITVCSIHIFEPPKLNTGMCLNL